MATSNALETTHEAERLVFRHMIDMGVDASRAKKVLAFLIWLESECGLKDIVKKVGSNGHKVTALVGMEAESAMALVQEDKLSPTTSSLGLEMILNLANPDAPDSSLLENVFEDKERALNGIANLVNGVCGMICDDILMDRSKEKVVEGDVSDEVRNFVRKWVATVEEGTVAEEGEKSEAVAPAKSKLNPYAKEWEPTSEEDRCLYITFSKGSPLSQLQIYNFFTGKYGPCTDRIYIHNRVDGPPLFGKIVFKTTTVPALILNGENEVKFLIDNRTMCCKKFRPTNNDDRK